MCGGGTKKITLGSIFCLYLDVHSGDLNQCSQACVASTSVTEPRPQPAHVVSFHCLVSSCLRVFLLFSGKVMFSDIKVSQILLSLSCLYFIFSVEMIDAFCFFGFDYS